MIGYNVLNGGAYKNEIMSNENFFTYVLRY